MTSHNLNEFIWEVRRHNSETVFPLLREHAFHTIYTRSYNIDDKTKDAIAIEMEEQLSFVSIVDEICFVLEHEDIPRDRELADYVRNLHKIFSGYSSEGNYSGRYFTKIMSFLEGFSSVIQLNSQRDEELLTSLHTMVSAKTGIGGSLDFFSGDATFYIDCKDRYTEKLREYFHVFNDFLQQETDKRQGLKVTTRTEQCLLTLTGMIEQMIFDSDAAMKLLNKYQTRLAIAENQKQYN